MGKKEAPFRIMRICVGFAVLVMYSVVQCPRVDVFLQVEYIYQLLKIHFSS